MPATTAAKPATGGKFLFDLRTVYFAVVATVSVLALGFSMISFLHDLVLLAFPALVEADTLKDIEYAARVGIDADSEAWRFRYEGPRYTEMVHDGIGVAIMGVIFWLHGVRFFRNLRG